MIGSNQGTVTQTFCELKIEIFIIENPFDIIMLSMAGDKFIHIQQFNLMWSSFLSHKNDGSWS